MNHSGSVFSMRLDPLAAFSFVIVSGLLTCLRGMDLRIRQPMAHDTGGVFYD